MSKITLILALFAWLWSSEAAAAPSAVSFSGRLSTAAGPVSGPVTVTFTIFDAQTGGTSVWSDSVAAVADQGLVFATLGSAGNALDETVFTGAARFLEIIVQGETLSPRLAINATPYSIRSTSAASADLLGTLSPSDVVTTINAGTGLTGGGSGNTVAIGIDPTKVQSRVAGSCGTNQSIQSIAQDGTVSCEPDSDTTYSALSGGGVSINSAHQVSVDTTVQRRTATTSNMTCPAGQYMQTIAQTGQTTCAPAITCSQVTKGYTSTSQQAVACPTGNIVMGGGCLTYTSIRFSGPFGTSAWYCTTASGEEVQAYAICCDIAF